MQALCLPGHGGAPDLPSEQWLEQLRRQLPEEPSIVVGWSLGGMLAMQLAALEPTRIAALILIGTTPRFRAAPDWPHGADEATFAAFAEGMAAGSVKMLGRFFALMFHGEELARSDYNEIARAAVDREHPPTAAGLAGGMELLATLDLRAMVPGIEQPVLVLHGDCDAIVPQAAGQWLAGQLPQAEFVPLDATGHAPFLSQSQQFNQTVEAWCQTISA